MTSPSAGGIGYGTVVVDMDTHRPIDLLPDRESATVAAWLSRRAEVEVVCRDRAGAFAEAARIAAPQAIQVADRWHVWHNLAQHAEKTTARHAACVAVEASAAAPVSDEPIPTATATDSTPARSRAGKLSARVRQHHQQIHALAGEGQGIKEIARELGLSRGTVRRYTRATTVEELLPDGPRPGRSSVVTPFAEHLWRRWNDGVTNATMLLEEIRSLGYRGGYSALRDYVRAFRAGGRDRNGLRRRP
jgi:transposase